MEYRRLIYQGGTRSVIAEVRQDQRSLKVYEMNESTKLNEMKTQLKGELAKWQTKIDEARIQLNLGGKEAKEKIQPHLDQLENEMYKAKDKWADLEEASENSWADIKVGLDSSVDAMKESFSNAQKHFSDDKTS